MEQREIKFRAWDTLSKLMFPVEGIDLKLTKVYVTHVWEDIPNERNEDLK